MPSHLCFTFRFLQPRYHGRTDGDEPEWPPSPLRTFQALVAAAAARARGDQFSDSILPAFKWLEQRSPPTIVSCQAEPASSKYRLYVPDNVADRVAKSWSAGRDASIADYRTEKDVRPMLLGGDSTVHFAYPIDSDGLEYVEALASSARSVTHLGWGIDMVTAEAKVICADEFAELAGERWQVSEASSGAAYRIPISGTFDSLIAKHRAFLNRLGPDGFIPVPPLSAFNVVDYRRATDPVARPCVVFELRIDDDSRFRYSQAKLIHIAGMVRHLAIELMQISPPSSVDNPANWVDSYVAGHSGEDLAAHRQLSYLPLPSIGHQHTEPSIRRVMIAAPMGDGQLIRHLAMLLTGQRLKPTNRTQINNPPTLVRVHGDTVARLYTKPSNSWASVTPIILPGHDDHKPEKTRRLIEKAFQQAGIEQSCEYEWSPFSVFPKSLSAHKYDRHKRPTGYIRPDHLLNQTAVHLKLRFANGIKVPGPLAIGSGRHCGLGLMAGIDA